MLKTAVALVLLSSPALSQENTKFCPENPDPNYGESIVLIPFGIAHFTEEWPRYCHVHHITGASLCITLPTFAGDTVKEGPKVTISTDSENPHIILGERIFYQCRD